MALTLPNWSIEGLLQEGAKAILYRGFRIEDQTPVIIKGLRPERCTPQNVAQLKHEYAIARRLTTSATIQAYGLETYQGIPYLILEDFGGRALDQVLSRFQEPIQFLKIAIKITAALADIHHHSVVHKDIKPANILINLDTDRVKIGDFGIAAFIPYEQQMVSSSGQIEGSLAYLSPEQTGRMNRGIDHRSDFYSLGVTFYEMLTGELPFNGKDPLEWAHYHIAKSPTPLQQVVATIPQTLSDMVLKLMSKVAEDRYQSALGLQFDLERCLQELETTGQISDFVLGDRDVSERFQIPQKLYGREPEIAQLLSGFDRVVTQATPELMLVSGYAGVGKSSLVNELHKPIVRDRGIFISGKFDQYKRGIPYATIVEAFQTLVRQLLTESETGLAHWQQTIQASLGNNGKLITDVIPEVELIVGEQPAVPELAPAESQNRFNLVFQNFIGAFAQKEHPLAIFLDDMQWADSATLSLIQTLVTGSALRHLYFILAFRDNEVDESHPFRLMVERLRQSGAKTTDIRLTPLNLAYVNQLIAETLHCNLKRSTSLAQVVLQKTDGNPFFVNEFLKALYQDGQLTFGSTEQTWQWNEADINAHGMTDNIVTLMVGRMQKLPSDTQQVLKLASCVGSRFDLEMLAIVAEQSPRQIADALLEAVLRGLVVITDAEKSYRFYHDRIQQAAYTLIADQEKQTVHLSMGRLLLKSIAPEHLEDQIFEVVNQLNRSINLITDATEKETLIRLNLLAGKKAKASTAYAPAQKLLSIATDLLTETAWSDRYHQTFFLFKERAECEFLAGNLDQAEALFGNLLLNAQSALDQATVYILQLRLYQVAGRYEEALTLGLEALEVFGVDFPETAEQMQAAIEREKYYAAVNLGDRSINSLIDAPVIQDPTLKMLVNLLTALGPITYFSKPSVFPLIVLTALNYSLKHGNTEDSCFAYSMYAMLLVSIFSDIPTGYAFSEMSIQLNEKFNDLRLRGTVLHIHGNHINIWCNPITTSISYLERAFIACVETGDISMANYTGFQGAWQMVEIGASIVDTEQSILKYARFAQQSKHQAAYQTIRLEQQLLTNLRGLTYTPETLSDDDFNESKALATIAEAGFESGIVFYHIIKTIVFFTCDRYSDALNSAHQASQFLQAALALPIQVNYVLYHSLVLTALYSQSSHDQQISSLAILEQHHQQLQYWANHCPANFLHKAKLVAAEIARIEGRDLDAMHLYEESIQSAREHGFVPYKALAYELAAKFYLDRLFDTIAKAYLENARKCYQRWGAIAKVNHLEDRYPTLLPKPIVNSNETFLSSNDQLDFLSVVKASQTISSEIVFPKLLKTLMRIVIEQAGADIGYLLLGSEQTLTVSVEAKINQKDTIAVSQIAQAENAQITPQSMLNYVQRTQETVILDDATKTNLFSEDDYIIQHQPKSVLCLPIVRQSQLLGIIYLENNLITGAFTHEKLMVLETLTTQIAISLENARLYQGLEDSQEQLNLVLKSAQIGIWSWNILANRLEGDDQVHLLFGLTVETFDGTTVINQVHPDDRAALRHSVQRAIAEGTEHDLESRIVRVDGTIRYIAGRGRAFFDETGKATRMSGVVMDVTERKQAEEQRLQLLQEQAKRAEAETANRAKDQFLAVLSHELRTPLNPILGWAKLLRSQKLDPAKTAQALETIERNAKLQTQLIEDLLDVSRIIQGKLHLNIAPVDLASTIAAALETVHLAVEAKSIDIQTDLHAIGQVLGDANRLQQVVWNLLSNAVKFTPTGGKITVRLMQVDGFAQLQISDTGQGILPEFLPHIFEAFRQADSTSTRAYGGLGLGLSIVRHIIDLHGGTVTAESL
ncbi:PAS domain S-box protein [Phormidesmis priestleyi ULC007]|uniref:histidine kinase n=1 Tax=Phormidesmis priestleyi ULC007 TaxID=1920490 RepID=A0A2T1DNN6_9CYAN|nr:AAA family ATPase [Phormidesmis priestleyi]PSB22065.1 PAS domain S-box protein [Phormidesmis priestleyi ULC007]PZO54967.1 MAG: PAS domain S-box protein [Phormidesmis priestleyi]